MAESFEVWSGIKVEDDELYRLRAPETSAAIRAAL
jgi:hypothetical protein